LPPPSEDEVTLAVGRAGICGSDLHTYRHGHPWLPYPIRPGHELSGVVVGIGRAVEGFHLGELVVVKPTLSCGLCRPCTDGLTNLCDALVAVGSHLAGGMAEELNLPARALVRAPEGLDLVSASLVEPAATAARAVRRAGGPSGRRVLVLGASTIGLLTLATLLAAGAERVAVTELDAAKRERALEWGAQAALDAGGCDVSSSVSRALAGAPDVIFDCVGNPTTLTLALDVVAKGGLVLVVGADHGVAQLPLDVVQDREVSIGGVAMYTDEDFRAALDFVAGHAPQVSGLVSAVLPVADASQAFELAASGRAVKVQLSGKADRTWRNASGADAEE
jgi:threonine dehydrogenase-like Zn-dependent dehydrogenase